MKATSELPLVTSLSRGGTQTESPVVRRDSGLNLRGPKPLQKLPKAKVTQGTFGSHFGGHLGMNLRVIWESIWRSFGGHLGIIWELCRLPGAGSRDDDDDGDHNGGQGSPFLNIITTDRPLQRLLPGKLSQALLSWNNFQEVK